MNIRNIRNVGCYDAALRCDAAAAATRRDGNGGDRGDGRDAGGGGVRAWIGFVVAISQRAGDAEERRSGETERRKTEKSGVEKSGSREVGKKKDRLRAEMGCFSASESAHSTILTDSHIQLHLSEHGPSLMGAVRCKLVSLISGRKKMVLVFGRVR